MKSNLVKFEQVNKKGSFIELTGKRAAEVSLHWQVEIIQGENRNLQELNYAIQLTSTLNGVSIVYSKADMEDTSKAKNIVRRLSNFGIIKQSYIKEIAESVNKALYSSQVEIKEVLDINSVWTNNILTGVSAGKYYGIFYKHFMSNPDLFPLRSSDKYQHNVSHGAILDHRKAPNGESLVAIRSGELKKLFSSKNDNKYREILESLLEMGVLEGELQQREIEMVEEIEGADEGNNYEVSTPSIKTTIRTKKKGLDQRLTMNTTSFYANVFVLTIDPEKGE